MEWVEYTRFVMALLFVLALIALAAWFARRLGLMPNVSHKINPGQRLQVLETLNVDAKRRLILVRHDQQEHLLLVGGDSDLLIDTRCRPSSPSGESVQRTHNDNSRKS